MVPLHFSAHYHNASCIWNMFAVCTLSGSLRFLPPQLRFWRPLGLAKCGSWSATLLKWSATQATFGKHCSCVSGYCSFGHVIKGQKNIFEFTMIACGRFGDWGVKTKWVWVKAIWVDYSASPTRARVTQCTPIGECHNGVWKVGQIVSALSPIMGVPGAKPPEALGFWRIIPPNVLFLGLF